MLHACALTLSASWEKSLSYAEFSYNNGYQSSLQMSLFEALYDEIYRTPLLWSETRNQTVVGTAMSTEVEQQVQLIREKLKAAQSRQKSYIDHHRRELSYEIGDFLYLKVSPLKGMKRLRVRGSWHHTILDPPRSPLGEEK